MQELWSVLNNVLLVIQCFAAIVGLFYFFKLKDSYWRWFGLYLALIFIQETLWTQIIPATADIRRTYNLVIGIPIQFIFLYWLYARKSLKKRGYFLLISSLYIFTIFGIILFKDVDTALRFNIDIGTIFLVILILLEFIKQIRTDNILDFRKNKMFYINLGAILFYVGTFPFQAFQGAVYKEYPTLVEFYYVYFIIANCLMYLLFIASFIWGKEPS